MYALGFWRPISITGLFYGYGLAILAVVAFGLYSLILVEGRYIGVFVVLFCADLIANIRIPDSLLSRRLKPLLGTTMISFLVLSIVVFNLQGFMKLFGDDSKTDETMTQSLPPSWPGEVAKELRRMGVQAGDNVGVIGYAFDSFWARLARVNIVAELVEMDADPFWVGDASLQAEVIHSFTKAGAQSYCGRRCACLRYLDRLGIRLATQTITII